MKKIENITIVRQSDDNPDLDWLGEYGNGFTENYVDTAKGVLYGEKVEKVMTEAEYEEWKKDEDQEEAWADPMEDGKVNVCFLQVLASGLPTRRGRDEYEKVGEFQHLPWEKQGWPKDCTAEKSFITEKQEAVAKRYVSPDITNHQQRAAAVYCCEDYIRLKTFGEDWWMSGIMAKAEIHTSVHKDSWLIQSVRSGGLWGIESDCGDEYEMEVAEEQLSELKAVLMEFGFPESEIDVKIAEAKEKGVVDA